MSVFLCMPTPTEDRRENVLLPPSPDPVCRAGHASAQHADSSTGPACFLTAVPGLGSGWATGKSFLLTCRYIAGRFSQVRGWSFLGRGRLSLKEELEAFRLCGGQ